jgi:hypothetical protein
MSLDKRRMARDLIVFGTLVVICWAIAILVVYHLVALVFDLFTR